MGEDEESGEWIGNRGGRDSWWGLEVDLGRYLDEGRTNERGGKEVVEINK